MTIRFYSFAPELDGTSDGKRFAGRFTLTLAALDKVCGKLRFRKTWFDVVGTTASAVLDHAVWLSEKIASMSDGVIMGMSQKLGHYRNDESPNVVASNIRQSGYVIASNGCEGTGVKVMTQKVLIPFVSEDVSRADLKALVGDKSYTSGVGSLGKIYWTNDMKTELAAYQLDVPIGAGVGDYEQLSNFALIDDEDAGPGVDATDPVLGEAA